MARGNGQMTIFTDREDYQRFLNLFRNVVEEYSVECWNYCLLPNHYHATLRPTLPNISAAVQQLNGRYAQWWNRRHGRVGHTFQGRFKAQIVQRDGYALALCRYVALNPVRARLVDRPEEWPWASYAATVGHSPAPPFLSVDATLGLFGDTNRDMLQRRFAEFVVAGIPCEEVDERIRSSQVVLGDAPFRTAWGQTQV
jgi:putative transposase